MSIGRVAGAVVCFLVFGGVAGAMVSSGRSDWREGGEQHDVVTKFYAVRQLWPALIAVIAAVVGPIVILLSGG